VAYVAPAARPSGLRGAAALGADLVRRTWARRSWYGVGAVVAFCVMAPFLSTGYVALLLSPKWSAGASVQLLADFINGALLMLVLSVADTAVLDGAKPRRTYGVALVGGALLASVLQWQLLKVLGIGTIGRGMYFPASHGRTPIGFAAASNLMVGGLLLWIHVQWRAAREGAQALHRAEHARLALAQQAETARLLALQSRIEPQGLFDVMAHVRALWRRDPVAGAALLDEAIATLRHAMPPPALQSTVARECALVEGQLRLRGVLDGAQAPSLQAELAPDLATARLAPLVLWPLVQWLVDAQRGATTWRLSARELRSAAGKPRLALRLHSVDAGWPSDDSILAVLRTRLAAVHGSSAELRVTRADGVDIELEVALKQVESHDADRIDR